MIKQGKPTYSDAGKAFEKQIKTIDDQGEKQMKALEEHRKQLVISSCEKESLTSLKQKEIFEEIANERIGEILNFSKQIDLNDLIYYFKGGKSPNYFISFKGPLAFYKNIKDSYVTLEKAEEKQQQQKSDMNEIVKGGHKSGKQKTAIKTMKTLQESREKVIKLFNDFSKITSKAKYRSIYGEGLKILTSKQMFQRLLIALALVKAGNTSEKLLNEIIQVIYLLYEAKEFTKKVCNNMMNSIKL